MMQKEEMAGLRSILHEQGREVDVLKEVGLEDRSVLKVLSRALPGFLPRTRMENWGLG